MISECSCLSNDRMAAAWIAASSGHLECLRLLHERGYPWDYLTCNDASYGGYLDCLIYAHEQGCPWDENICNSAALNGHLDCLQYAHEHGCPWDEDTYLFALYNNQLNCVIYAYKHRCPGWEKYYERIKDQLLKENRSLFHTLIRLKIYAFRFRNRHYTPGGKGYLKSMQHFRSIA